VVESPAVKRFILMVVLVAVTSLLFYATADGSAQVLGMRLTCMDMGGDPCWIGIGAKAVIVLGGGVGVIEIGLYGAGILFATGQLAGGLLAVGQLAIGVVGFLGQVATGMVGMAQGGVGWITVTQGGDNEDGKAFFKRLSADLEEALRFLPERKLRPPD
jgi:hypothetical protein